MRLAIARRDREEDRLERRVAGLQVGQAHVVLGSLSEQSVQGRLEVMGVHRGRAAVGRNADGARQIVEPDERRCALEADGRGLVRSELSRRPLPDDPTAMHDRYPVGELLGFLKVVGGQEHRSTPIA